ncbi:MAG: D-alanine--D-alanine ligase, partial [Planctomycetaceae bacterium]|nr:D-alanine--D-alanine ligase [Planctomycetaceae bacterium]
MRSPHFLDPVTSSDRNWRVAVVCGGTSAEREISLQSGAAVIAALHGRGHLVRAIDPLYQPVREVDWNRFDVAFLALHGTVGEDGVIQRQLDSLGVPYTGSDAESSALAFHKVSAKVRFQQAGLPTPPWIPIREVTQPICDRIARQLGFPVAIKPVAQGSSLGVTIVRERAELPIACERALSYSEEGLAERAIPGEEWTVSLLDDEILGAIH